MYVFAPPPQPSVAVLGSQARFPVRRIFCVGRNYAHHVREMGNDPKSEPPVFFTKPADAVCDSGAAIPYALNTDNLHYEVELVVALGAGGAESRPPTRCRASGGTASASISPAVTGRPKPRRTERRGMRPKRSTSPRPSAL
jgi:2-keto-4-pentenoate hydratase/2-oxohepta-3-ene-1,7-dioic acid hydratase in catechol pathway